MSPKRKIPDHIKKPDYAETGEPLSERIAKSTGSIDVKTPEKIEGMRKVCRVSTS